MLDSGTTFTYLREDAFSLVQNQFNSYCSQKGTSQFIRCGKNPVIKSGLKYCVNFDNVHYKNLENFFNSFPKLYFKLGPNVNIIWFAKDYLTKSSPSLTGGQVFCSSIHVLSKGKKNST